MYTTGLYHNGVKYEWGKYTRHFVPTANTIAYYPLTSSTTTQDRSGNNYNLTNYNVVFQDNYALINGTGAYLYRNTSSDNFVTGAGARTVSAWIYVVSFASGVYAVWQGENSNKKVWAFNLDKTTKYGIDTWGSGNGAYVNSGYPLGSRHLLTTTYNGSTMYVYLDGQLKTSATQTVNTSKSSLYVGKDPVYSATTQHRISDLIFENKARTAQEIADYYQNTKSNYGL